MQRRMTDRRRLLPAPPGRWRSGDDLYQIADDNDWHYNYPPLFAIVLTPLADAPAGADRSALLPYPVSVALWFVINLLCGFVAIHWLARALEECSPDPAVRAAPVGCQAWWRRRVVPLLICLPPIAHTLMRGQVNLIVLLLLAGMLGPHLRGRRFTAGLWARRGHLPQDHSCILAGVSAVAARRAIPERVTPPGWPWAWSSVP